MGGGCLSLKKHFARWCGQEEDKFIGSWDLGQLLQLIYGDTFKKTRIYKNLTRKCTE
jgi:hypothetical protein